MSNLKGGWDTLWGAITSGFPSLPVILNIAAVVLFLIWFVGWLLEKRKSAGSGGEKQRSTPWVLIFAAVLAIPALILPIVLGLTDQVINFFGNLVGRV